MSRNSAIQLRPWRSFIDSLFTSCGEIEGDEDAGNRRAHQNSSAWAQMPSRLDFRRTGLAGVDRRSLAITATGIPPRVPPRSSGITPPDRRQAWTRFVSRGWHNHLLVAGELHVGTVADGADPAGRSTSWERPAGGGGRAPGAEPRKSMGRYATRAGADPASANRLCLPPATSTVVGTVLDYCLVVPTVHARHACRIRLARATVVRPASTAQRIA